nr:uncharacterized protein LOC111414752 [Onthophagus taurus]
MNSIPIILVIFFLISTIQCAPTESHKEKIIKFRSAVKMYSDFLENPEPPLTLISTRTFLNNTIDVIPKGVVLRRCHKEIVFSNKTFVCKSIEERKITIEINFTVMTGNKPVNKMHKIHTVEHTKCDCKP